MKNLKNYAMAIVAFVIAATTFTSMGLKSLKPQTNLKWFSISGNYTPTSAVPSANATYLGEGTTPPPAEECGTGTTHQCVSGFNPDTQVNSMNQLIGSQIPASTPLRKQ